MRARLCSQNAHKLEELRAALPGWEVELLEAGDYPPEDRRHLRGERAREGAVRAARRARRRVDARARTPGSSATPSTARRASTRRAGRRRPTQARGARASASTGEPNRRARMVAALVAVAPDGREVVGAGILEGTVADEPRGDGGFGYDPIFVPAGETQTVAELGDEWKRENSHRAERPPRCSRHRR